MTQKTYLFFALSLLIFLTASIPVGNEKYKQYIFDYKQLAGNFPDSLYESKLFDAEYLMQQGEKLFLPYEPIDYQLLNACVFYQTQLYREKMKKNPLLFYSLLRDAAIFHALQMSEKKFYSHDNNTISKMKTPQQRIFNFGTESEFSGENINKVFAINYKDGKPYGKEGNHFYYTPSINDTIPFHTYNSLAEKIVNSWIQSPPHKKNMLLKDYTHLGCATVLEAASLKGKNLPAMLAVQNFAGKIQ